MKRNQSSLAKIFNAIPKPIKRHKILIGVIVVLLVFSIPFAIDFIRYRLSIIPTVYGDVFFDGEDMGIVDSNYITQFVDVFEDVPYMTYELETGAYITEVNVINPIAEENLAQGVLVGYEIYFLFDNEAATEEVFFWNFDISLTGVRWEQVVIYDGTGSQVKVFTSAPQEDSAYFFVFMYQSELQSNIDSFFIQIKGFHHSDESYVFLTVYYSLVYIYQDIETTTTATATTQPPYASSYPFLLAIFPLFLVPIVRRKKNEI